MPAISFNMKLILLFQDFYTYFCMHFYNFYLFYTKVDIILALQHKVLADRECEFSLRTAKLVTAGAARKRRPVWPQGSSPVHRQ